MKFHEAYEALVNGSAKKLRKDTWIPGSYAALNENENGVLYLYSARGGGEPWDGAPMLQEGWEVVLNIDSPDKSFEQLVERIKTEPIDPLFMVDCVLRYAAANGVHPDHAHVIGRGASHELHQLVAEIATCDSKADPKGILAAVRNFLLQRGYPDPEAKRGEATAFDTLVEELRVLLETPGLNSPCVVEAIFPLVVEHVVAFCRRSGVPIPPFFGGGTDTTPELIELLEQLVSVDAGTRRPAALNRKSAQQLMLDALSHFFKRRGYPPMIALVNAGTERAATAEEVEGLAEALAAGHQRRATPTECDAIDQALAEVYGDLHDEELLKRVERGRRRRFVEDVDPTRQIVDAAEKVRREIERAQRRYRVSDPVWYAMSGLGSQRFRWR